MCTFRINGTPFPHKRCVIRFLLLINRFHISHVLTIHLQAVGSAKHTCKECLCISMILKHVVTGRYRELRDYKDLCGFRLSNTSNRFRHLLISMFINPKSSTTRRL